MIRKIVKIALGITLFGSLTSCVIYPDNYAGNEAYYEPYYYEGYYYAPQNYYGYGGYWGGDGYYYRNDFQYYYDNGMPYYYGINRQRIYVQRNENHYYNNANNGYYYNDNQANIQRQNSYNRSGNTNASPGITMDRGYQNQQSQRQPAVQNNSGFRTNSYSPNTNQNQSVRSNSIRTETPRNYQQSTPQNTQNSGMRGGGGISITPSQSNSGQSQGSMRSR